MGRKIGLFTAAAILFLLIPQTAWAHPLDEIGDVRTYDQTQIITVSPDTTTLTINLTFYPLDKMKVWESIDRDRDQQLTGSEKDRWMKLGMDASWIEKNGILYNFEATGLDFPEYYDFFSPKPSDVSINFKSELASIQGDKIYYHYKGKDKPLSEINFEAKGKNGLNLSKIELSDKDLVGFEVGVGNQTESEIWGLKASSRLNNFLNKYVKVEKVPLSLALTALIVAFLIGMLHALTPGHGKAIVAGYLVGEKGSIWHAVELGIIITITHTSSVFILGLAALFLTQYVVPAKIVYAMNTISGILVTGFGLYLLVKRVLGLIYQKLEHKHNHLHNIDHLHEDEVGVHDHIHDHEKLNWKSLVPLGVSGGIVPCIDALAILIVAISLGKIVFGITLLILFSLGLATALIIGGILVVITKNISIKSVSAFAKYERYISIASALIVTILGIAIILNTKI